MSLPKVRICGYCGKSLGLETDHRLKPGLHSAKIEVTKEMCPECEKKFNVGDVTPADPLMGNNPDGGKP